MASTRESDVFSQCLAGVLSVKTYKPLFLFLSRTMSSKWRGWLFKEDKRTQTTYLEIGKSIIERVEARWPHG